MATRLRVYLMAAVAIAAMECAGSAKADDENSRIADKIVACINARANAVRDAELQCDHLTTDPATLSQAQDAPAAPAADTAQAQPATDAAVDALFGKLDCLKEEGQDAQLACMERLKATESASDQQGAPAAPQRSADPACWSDTVSLDEKRSRNCLTADVQAGPDSTLAPLDDLPHLRISCCDGAAPRFEQALLPDALPDGLVARWTARMPDRSILMVDGYDSAAAAQQAASYAGAVTDEAGKSALVERYLTAVAAMGDRAPPARARIDSTIVTLEAGAYPLPGERGTIPLYTRCFSMEVKRSYVLCNAYLPGSVAVVTNLRQTRSTDGKVATAPVQLLDALLGEGVIRGSLPATPPS